MARHELMTLSKMLFWLMSYGYVLPCQVLQQKMALLNMTDEVNANSSCIRDMITFCHRRERNSFTARRISPYVIGENQNPHFIQFGIEATIQIIFLIPLHRKINHRKKMLKKIEKSYISGLESH